MKIFAIKATYNVPLIKGLRRQIEDVPQRSYDLPACCGHGNSFGRCCWCNFRSNRSCFVLCTKINVKHKHILWRQVNHWFFSLQKSWACSALSVSAAPSRGSTILKPESFNPLWLFWVFEIFGHWSFRSQILIYVLSMCRSLCLAV